MSAVSEQYAVALFQLSMESKTQNEMIKALKNFNEALDKETLSFFSHPNIQKKSKKDVVSKTEYPGLFKDFLKVLIDNNRIQLVPSIVDDFHTLLEDLESVMRIEVYANTPLSKQQIDDLKTSYNTRYNREIIVDFKLDESIIGGMRIEYKGMVLNDTVNHSINKIKTRLLK